MRKNTRTFATLLAAGLSTVSAAACGRKAPPAGAPRPEAVSVGYGSQSPNEVTGAVASVSARDIENTRPTRLEDFLQGRVAGMQVSRTSSGDYSIRIRGAGTVNGSGEPLYVVDGTPVEARGLLSALGGIAVQDIDRIEVLKDAGATGIYGSRGGNGVVIIKTKRTR
jgi:TonB-dependent SusC/RagA subfamily outer membrane receptor